MANFKGHAIGGLVTSVLYLTFLALFLSINLVDTQRQLFSGYLFPVSLTFLTTLFALWPDIDTNSKGQDIVYRSLFVFDIFLVYKKQFVSAAYLGLFAMLPIIDKHRGWTHKRLMPLIVPLPLLLIPMLTSPVSPWRGVFYYAAACLGYLSHLLLDGLLFKPVKSF